MRISSFSIFPKRKTHNPSWSALADSEGNQGAECTHWAPWSEGPSAHILRRGHAEAYTDICPGTEPPECSPSLKRPVLLQELQIQLTIIICGYGYCICKFAYLLKFICNLKISTLTSVSGHAQNGGKVSVRPFPAEVSEVHALPPHSSSPQGGQRMGTGP